MSTLFSLQNIVKNYGAVRALRGVDLDINEGDALAICGDNGAGKSTLIRILSGAENPTSGTMALRGDPVVFHNPHDALSKGVATIYQDLALAPRSTIYQNVFMGAERTRTLLPFIRVLDKKRMMAEAQDYLSRLNPDMRDMKATVETLSGGQRQAVAISRALRWNADLIIMDEPTAALGVRETAQVRDLILNLRKQGKTVILISHDMSDVVAVASRVAILRQGVKIADRTTDGLNADDLSQMVMGGETA